MSNCNFCQKQDDTRDMKIYGACDISNGKPCGPCTEYLELEAQIEGTRKALEAQLEQRRKIRRNVNRVHDAMLIRVPPEITAYIFELAASVDVPPDGSTPLLEGELYAPLPLGQVCVAWRNISCDMPQLWSFMFARIRSVEDLPMRLDIATQWLSRSGECSPLSIHFRLHETPDCEEDPFWNVDEYEPFIGLLNSYSHRWKDLCGLGPFFVFEYLSANSKGAPMLQHLQLSVTNMINEMDFDLGCEPQPQPRSIHFHDVYLPDIHINWSHVTRLTTNSIVIDVFLDLLPQLHALKELGVCGVDGYNNRPSRSVTHVGIQSLDIQCIQHSTTYILCNFLNLPSLRQLKIDLARDRNMLLTIISLIRRSSCTLSSLSLSYCPPNSLDALILLLECTNLIEKLEISTFSKNDWDFLEALQNRMQHQNNYELQHLPFPNLQCLSYILDSCSPQHVLWNTLLLVFDPSWGPNLPPWKTLSIRPCPSSRDWDQEPQNLVHEDLPEEVLRRLVQLVEAGIELFLPRKLSREKLFDMVKAKEDANARHAAESAEIQAELAQWVLGRTLSQQ